MPFTLQAAKEIGIPDVVFWTTNACSFLGIAHFKELVAKGFAPLKDETYLENGHLDTIIDWITGMIDIQLAVLPSFIRTTDPNDSVLNFLITSAETTYEAPAVIFNTFDDIEQDVVNDLSAIFSKIYTVGPLHLLLSNIPENGLKYITSNLWKEDPECLHWLDSKKTKSAVYVNFGSITVLTKQQMVELAWGLAHTKQNFLWIIRADLVKGESAVLPAEFVEETKGRGLLASWCWQVKVMNHPSIGGFLTHNGWNSTLESVSGGVPMICWPFYADQQTNCWFTCNKWGIGMKMNEIVKRDVSSEACERANGGREGQRDGKKAEEAISVNGFSYLNLKKLVE